MNNEFFKRNYLFLVLVLLGCINVFAQPRQRMMQERQREVESQRVAFITNELSLTPAEAEKFWPLYNEYNTRRNQMLIRFGNIRLENVNVEGLSDAELHKIADAEIESMQAMADLRREYHEKFKKILPIRKVVQLYQAERDFNRHLMRDFRQNQNRQAPAGRRPDRQ